MLSFLLRPALAYMPALQPGAVGPATSVRMQVVAPAPAAKRPSTGGGGYVGRGKRDAAVNDETMRWYNTEEIRLAMAIKELLRWQKVQRQLEELDRMPTRRTGNR